MHGKQNDWYKVFNETNFKKEIEKLVACFNTNDIIVQGEAIGKFNGNYHKIKNDEIRLFNICVDGKRLKQDKFIEVCMQQNIPHCPFYKIIELNHSMDEVLKISEIKDVINSNVEAEGLVWRCIDDNFSFKVINNKYLLTNIE